MYQVLKEDFKTYLYKIIHHHEFMQLYKVMRLMRSPLIQCHIVEANLMLTDGKKVDIEQTVNHQNG